MCFILFLALDQKTTNAERHTFSSVRRFWLPVCLSVLVASRAQETDLEILLCERVLKAIGKDWGNELPCLSQTAN
jgi:ribosomal protein L28